MQRLTVPKRRLKYFMIFLGITLSPTLEKHPTPQYHSPGEPANGEAGAPK